MSDFFITCASNLYTSDFPNNTPWYFITPLPKPLELDKEKWECGLAEISFPNSWHNLPTNELQIKVLKNNNIILNDNVEGGLYTVQEFITYLNQWLHVKLHGKKIEFMLQENALRLRIVIDTHYEIQMTPILSKKLGFQGVTHLNSTRLSSEPVDLDLNNAYMFVYSNLIEESYVGNSYVKLLRPVTIKTKTPHQYTINTYDSPHYRKLATSFENSIEISLSTIEGKPFKLNSGVVIVTLHFRKLNNA